MSAPSRGPGDTSRRSPRLRNVWFRARFGYDRRTQTIRSRPWWRAARRLRRPFQRRRCEACRRAPATHFVWSHKANRHVGFCDWCNRRFEFANTNRRNARAFARAQRRTTKGRRR